MQYVFGFRCVLSLGLLLVIGCSVGTGAGGGAGSYGCGGAAGWPEPPSACEGFVCSCDRPGIEAAIRAGGGPYTFDCGGPWTLVTVVTQLNFEIDKDVVLDGEGYLTVESSAEDWVFSVPEGVTAELHGFTVRANPLEDHEYVAISNMGTLTLADSTVSGSQDGGGVYNVGTLTMNRSTVAGVHEGWIFEAGIFNEGTMTLVDSVVSNNEFGISNLGTAMLVRSTVSSNSLGILNQSGTIMLMESAVSNNTAGLSSGFDPGTFGSGIFNSDGGAVTLVSSTVWDNDGGCPIANGVFDIFTNEGSETITLTNSTVSNPLGICNGEEGNLTLSNATLGGEVAEYGGALELAAGSTTTLVNSVLIGDCIGDGAVTSGGYNIQSPNDSCSLDAEKGDLVSVSEEALNLEGLSDAGGPTKTMALRSPSIAIDLIPPERCVDAEGEGLTRDQRGELRPSGSGCDAGAVEWQPGDPTGTD